MRLQIRKSWIRIRVKWLKGRAKFSSWVIENFLVTAWRCGICGVLSSCLGEDMIRLISYRSCRIIVQTLWECTLSACFLVLISMRLTAIAKTGQEHIIIILLCLLFIDFEIVLYIIIINTTLKNNSKFLFD